MFINFAVLCPKLHSNFYWGTVYSRHWRSEGVWAALARGGKRKAAGHRKARVLTAIR